MDTFDFFNVMANIEDEVEHEAELLFDGKEHCTDEEADIIFNSDLSFEEKIAKLQVIRGDKQVKPLSFKKRVTPDDQIRAQALGVELD